MFTLPTADDWVVFHGDANPAEARIYVRMTLPEADSDARFAATIDGPFSRYARTLPAKSQLVSHSRSGHFQADGILPDPCFWTPELPNLYRVRVALTRNGGTLWEDERLLGIKRFGPRGNGLYMEGKNWVLRGSFVQETADFDWDAWREQSLAAVVTNPTESFCHAADERGLFLVAVDQSGETPLREKARLWQRHPSIGVVVTEAPQSAAVELTNAPGIVVASRQHSDMAPIHWNDVNPTTSVPAARPTILVRHVECETVASRRGACDLLQRDSAQNGLFAGYVT